MDESSLHERAQFLWVGTRLSPIERLALTSFRDHGWDTVLYVYDEVDNIPQGVRVEDGNSILDRSKVFPNNFEADRHVESATFTTFANQFRLHLLTERGGW